jgi:serine/threonine-protein kinase HipA
LENEFVTTILVRELLPEDKTSKVKLASVVLPAQNNEESTVRIAPALLIERFDRTPDNRRAEMYEFNQLLGKTTEEKYEGSFKEMADFIQTHANESPSNGIKTNQADIEILFKRILVSLLVENADTHLKNFALMRTNPDDEFRLTPNYDLVSCARYDKEYSKIALAIGATRILPLRNLQPKHIVQLATDFGILSAEPTIEEAQRLKQIIETIGNQLKRLKPAVENPIGGSPYPDIEKIAQNGHLKGELKDIYGTATRRWNGTFSKVEFFLAKKIVNRSEPITPVSLDFIPPYPTFKNG